MSGTHLSDYCLDWLNRDISDARFKRILAETKTSQANTELWDAAHDAVKRGRHDGPCDNRGNADNDACTIHLDTAARRRDRLIAALGRFGVVEAVPK